MGTFETIFLIFIAIGFCAQLIDGALGMAYGITSTTALIATGMPPAVASANVHAAEVVTTAISGGSHALAGNVDFHLLWRLAPFGALGAVLGAMIAASIDISIARPLIAAYLLSMGSLVIWRGIRNRRDAGRIGRVRFLAVFGGFYDALGGGGWGPVVTSNLIARGQNAARTIGTVNMAEFFMTSAATIAFASTLGFDFGAAFLGLLAGGALAAPIAALAVKRAPRAILTILVGGAVCLLSIYNLVAWFFR